MTNNPHITWAFSIILIPALSEYATIFKTPVCLFLFLLL